MFGGQFKDSPSLWPDILYCEWDHWRGFGWTAGFKGVLLLIYISSHLCCNIVLCIALVCLTRVKKRCSRLYKAPVSWRKMQMRPSVKIHSVPSATFGDMQASIHILTSFNNIWHEMSFFLGFLTKYKGLWCLEGCTPVENKLSKEQITVHIQWKSQPSQLSYLICIRGFSCNIMISWETGVLVLNVYDLKISLLCRITDKCHHAALLQDLNSLLLKVSI